MKASEYHQGSDFKHRERILYYSSFLDHPWVLEMFGGEIGETR